jgi:hypothetical protein
MRLLKHLMLLGCTVGAAAIGQSAEGEVHARMRAALEAQAPLPQIAPRLPGDGRTPGAAVPDEVNARRATQGASDSAKGQGQSSLAKARAEALKHLEADVDGPGNSAAGMARANAAKAKAKKAHKQPDKP